MPSCSFVPQVWSKGKKITLAINSLIFLFSLVLLNNATMVNYSVYGLHVHADRYEGHSFYMWWCFCGLGENYIREVLALPHFNMLSGVSS